MSQNRSSSNRPPQNRNSQKSSGRPGGSRPSGNGPQRDTRSSSGPGTQSQKRFKIRAQHVNSGKITTELLTKKQIAVGFDDRDLNIEDIGIALLNDLRESMGLEPIEADFEEVSSRDEDDESEDEDDEDFDDSEDDE